MAHMGPQVWHLNVVWVLDHKWCCFKPVAESLGMTATLWGSMSGSKKLQHFEQGSLLPHSSPASLVHPWSGSANEAASAVCCGWHCRRDINTYPKKLKILWIHTSKIWIKLACQDGHQKEEDSCLALIRQTTPDIYARTTQFIWRQSVQNWRRSSQFIVILGIKSI